MRYEIPYWLIYYFSGSDGEIGPVCLRNNF